MQVDYNLYGMGHLHVNKMKFRNPVPASFSSKLFARNDTLSQESNNSTSQQVILLSFHYCQKCMLYSPFCVHNVAFLPILVY